jgi:hypothetical protein
MRQHSWLELIKDYDCYMLYHPDRANVVANPLSMKSREDETDPIVVIEGLTHQFAIVHIEDVQTDEMSILATPVVEPLAPSRICLAQKDDLELRDLVR